MRNQIFMIIFAVFIMIASSRGQWEILNEGGSFKTVDFVNDEVGFVAGYETLLKTEDGGVTWQYISVDSEFDLRHIDFIEENVGWATTLGYKGGIVKTSDGCRSWQVMKRGEFETFCAIDENILYTGSTDGDQDSKPLTLIKTVDGGKNWNDISPTTNSYRMVKSICFQNTMQGFFLGNTFDEQSGLPNGGLILRTADGGETLTEEVVPEFEEMYGLKFLDESTAFFIGVDRDDGTVLYMTKDTLKTWTQVKNDENFTDYYSVDKSTIFALMQDDSSTSIIKSIDGGLNWTNKMILLPHPSWGILGSCEMCFLNDDVGYIAIEGITDCIYETHDGGENWNLQKFSFPLEGISIIDENRAIIYGSQGFAFGSGFSNMFITDDAGQNWSVHSESIGDFINKMLIINESDGYALVHSLAEPWAQVPHFYKTVNGGGNWNMQSEEIPLSLALDMAFKNTDVGWIVGEYEDEGMIHASIIETIDGGKTWENVWIDGEQGTILNSIHYCDDLCIAVGNDGLVVKREGSDSFKKISSFTNQNLVKVHLSDAQHGWIIGEEGHKFFKTENSGENWSELSDFNNIVNDLYFIDASHGWAVGCDTDGRGLILKTGNGGESWDVQVEDLSASLITIEIKDEYIWAAGEEGLILKSDVTSDIWIDERTKKIYPTKYRLSQNYPNPFNPSTTIEFDLPKASNVMIEVYNIAGQKVQTLLNENIAVGNHQVEFNAEYLSSGVYFYKIAAGEFQDVKKMILLR